MISSRRRLGLLSPFLAGMAGATAVETSVGLLLFADDGLLPALTLILTLEMAALSLGLWSGSISQGKGAVEHIRRRWLFCLIVFSVAAILAAGLNFMESLSGTGIGQGMGLAFLGALPLFSVGSLLGAMSRSDRTGPNPGSSSLGAPVVAGAAVGFFIAGSVLIPNAAPHTLYLFSLVLLSGGALFQGWVLDSRLEVEVLDSRSGITGEIRVERRALGSSRRELKVLLEDGLLRGAEDAEGNPGRGWEAAVLQASTGDVVGPGSVLFLGGGSGTLVRALAHRAPDTRIHAVERSEDLVTLARSHFTEWDPGENQSLEFSGPLSPSAESEGPFSLVLADGQALPTLGGAPWLREADWRFLANAVGPGGALVRGGLRAPEGPANGPLFELMLHARDWFDEVAFYREDGPPSHPRLLHEIGAGSECFLRFTKTGAPAWPLSLSGFSLQPSRRG